MLLLIHSSCCAIRCGVSIKNVATCSCLVTAGSIYRITITVLSYGSLSSSLVGSVFDVRNQLNDARC